MRSQPHNFVREFSERTKSQKTSPSITSAAPSHGEFLQGNKISGSGESVAAKDHGAALWTGEVSVMCEQGHWGIRSGFRRLLGSWLEGEAAQTLNRLSHTLLDIDCLKILHLSCFSINLWVLTKLRCPDLSEVGTNCMAFSWNAEVHSRLLVGSELERRVWMAVVNLWIKIPNSCSSGFSGFGV